MPTLGDFLRSNPTSFPTPLHDPFLKSTPVPLSSANKPGVESPAPKLPDPCEKPDGNPGSVAPAAKGNGGFSGHKGFELGNHPSQPVRNAPATIGDRQFSGHALDQMQNRGIPPSVVDNTIKHGTPFPGNRPGTQGYHDAVSDVRVIVNSDNGTVVTVIPGGG